MIMRTMANPAPICTKSLSIPERTLLSVAFCVLFVWGVLRAEPAKAPAIPPMPASFDVAAIDRHLAATITEPRFVGLTVAVVRNGEVVLAKGYGKRSLADGRPVTADTAFGIGSVTKQFTCACILLLAEEGKLSVMDQVAKYYPNLTRAGDITLLDLMNHTSGYPDYYPLDFLDTRMRTPISPDALLSQYAGGKLDFEPGTRWSYSNTGFVLLARVVERVSGQPMGEFLAKRIFGPLGMAHTMYEPSADDPRVAWGYASFALSPPSQVPPEAPGWLGGAGAICSTPTDLAKWDLALMDGKLLRPDSFALMAKARALDNGRLTGYGCGWQVREQNGRIVMSHGGAVSGFNASNTMIPSTRSAVVAIANFEDSLGSVPGDILRLLLLEPSNVPRVQGLSAADQSRQLFLQLQTGKLDRSKLAPEFNLFLTPEKASATAARFKPYGNLKSAETLSLRERGGLEVSSVRLTFAKGRGSLRTLMYRQPGGLVEQFFVSTD